MSGTLEIEAAHGQKMKDYEQSKREDEQDLAKLDAMILRTKNEKKQIEKETEQIKKENEQRKRDDEQENAKLDAMILRTRNENERLAVLESKIDASFSKHGINLPLTQIQGSPS